MSSLDPRRIADLEERLAAPSRGAAPCRNSRCLWICICKQTATCLRWRRFSGCSRCLSRGLFLPPGVPRWRRRRSRAVSPRAISMPPWRSAASYSPTSRKSTLCPFAGCSTRRRTKRSSTSPATRRVGRKPRSACPWPTGPRTWPSPPWRFTTSDGFRTARATCCAHGTTTSRPWCSIAGSATRCAAPRCAAVWR